MISSVSPVVLFIEEENDTVTLVIWEKWDEPEEGVIAQYCAQIPVEAAIVWLFFAHAIFLLITTFLAKLNRSQLHWDQV